MLKAMNSRPWTMPVIRTAWGISHTYFMGMATKRRSRNEMPSMMATARRQPKEVCSRVMVAVRGAGGGWCGFSIWEDCVR